MKEIILKPSIALLIGIGFGANAQTATVSVSGGEAVGSNGTVGYSVGQVLDESYTSSSGSVHTGIMASFEIILLSDASEQPHAIQLKAYPNPTSNYLELKADQATGDLQYQLLEIDGRTITFGRLNNSSALIDMTLLPSKTYFLKVMTSDRVIQTFKIIKN